MPHAIVSLPLTIADIRAQFSSFDIHHAGLDLRVHFKDAFESVERPTLLIETYIRQQPQDQRLGLIIAERPDAESEFIVKMHELGFPRVTDGTHFAIGRLTDWLVGLHEDGKIKTHTLQVFRSAETV